MQKLKSVKILMVVIIFLLSACVMDWKAGIAIVKNNTSSRILIAIQPDELMTDSTLYNERFSEILVEPNLSRLVTLSNIKLISQSDSVKAYLYMFNCDSVDKYQELKKMQGIIKSSFIRKIEIQLNKVKEPLDTIYIR